MQFQLDLSVEDYLAFSCIGHDPHTGGGPLGVHGGWESLEGGFGDQTQWTASVTLNSQVERSHGNVLHQ